MWQRVRSRSRVPAAARRHGLGLIRSQLPRETLNAFWTQATTPDPELVQDLLRAIAGSIQIRGVFFREPGLGHAVQQAVARLLDGTVGRPGHPGDGQA